MISRGSAFEIAGDALARIVERGARAAAERVHRRGVAEVVGQQRQHRLERLATQRRRRSMIQVHGHGANLTRGVVGGRSVHNCGMTEPAELLRNSPTILLIDWPSREVPDSLARAGHRVVSHDGPDDADYNVYELSEGKVEPRAAGGPPEHADLVYATGRSTSCGHRRQAVALGARTAGRSGLARNGEPDRRGLAVDRRPVGSADRRKRGSRIHRLCVHRGRRRRPRAPLTRQRAPLEAHRSVSDGGEPLSFADRARCRPLASASDPRRACAMVPQGSPR